MSSRAEVDLFLNTQKLSAVIYKAIIFLSVCHIQQSAQAAHATSVRCP